jgi:NAD(P)-dependent dehydrogenase (short-subunit alcohol dehydrogenase family)
MTGVLLITDGSRGIGAAEAVVAEIAAAGGAAAFQGVVAWLLSDAASFISGACIDVSGGGFIVGHR